MVGELGHSLQKNEGNVYNFSDYLRTLNSGPIVQKIQQCFVRRYLIKITTNTLGHEI